MPDANEQDRPLDRYDAALAEIRAFVDEREWAQFHDPKNLAMAVASEAGELLSELRWVEGAQADAYCRDPETRGPIADEIADVAVCLFMLADRIDLDLFEAIRGKIAKNHKKYPADEWRGR